MAVRETHEMQTVRLLDAVRSFTAEREREALMSTLLKTMLDVLPASAIAFHPCEAHAAGSDIRVCKPGTKLNASTVCTRHELIDVQGIAGTISIEHLPGRHIDSQIVDALLRIYCNFVAVINDSHHDTLTGLLNRKTFERSIQNVLLESRTTVSGPLMGEEQRKDVAPDAGYWLAVIDIDHFKRVNDNFGHLYGDEVLIMLARLMLQSFRKSDRVYRFGGEEFAVLLSPCSEPDVRAVLERFRETVENHGFSLVGQITISIGFVAVSSQDIPATVIGHADEALYDSKHSGRNRVTSYHDLAVRASTQQESSVDLF